MKSQGTSTDKVTKAMSRARRHQIIFVALLLLLRACSRPLLAGPRLDDIDDGGMVKKRNVASSSPPQLPILSLSLSQFHLHTESVCCCVLRGSRLLLLLTVLESPCCTQIGEILHSTRGVCDDDDCISLFEEADFL
jgi:hypothetical protein